MKTAASSCVLAALLFGGCASDRSAGNSVETESDIAARLLRVDSVLPEWNPVADGGTVATLRFDRWNFDFANSTSDGRDIRLERQDSSLLPFEVVAWDSGAKYGRIHVRLDSSASRPGARIRLRWGKPFGTILSDPARTWQGISDSQRLAINSVLVDDFESGSNVTLLPTRTRWEAYAGDSAEFRGLVYDAAGKGRPGRAQHLLYKATGLHYAIVRTPLIRETLASRNFRALDSIVFWARGNGKLFVAFEGLVNGSGPKAWALRTLDSGWTRFRVRPKDLDTVESVGGNVRWNKVRDSVTHVTFIAVTGTDVWLDDVRLHGVDLGDVR